MEKTFFGKLTPTCYHSLFVFLDSCCNYFPIKVAQLLCGGHDELKEYEEKLSVPWLPRCAFSQGFLVKTEMA